MTEEDITPEKLLAAVDDLYKNRQKYIDAMDSSPQSEAIDKIMSLIKDCSK